MVKLLLDDPLKSIELLNVKNVYCFGAGKRFQNFATQLKDIEIKSIIDNFLSENNDSLLVGDKTFSIISFDEYVSRASAEDALIITSVYYKEIVKQLDEQQKLDGVSCFVMGEVTRDKLQEYINSRNEQRPDSEVVFSGDGKHYQIWEYIDSSKDAGSKAPMDMRSILGAMGYETIGVHMDCCRYVDAGATEKNWMEKRSGKEWQSFIDNITPGAILALQHPFRVENRFRDEALVELKKKGVKIISIVHDVEMIRGLNFSDYYEKEMNFMMDIADAVIVQNDSMKAFFQNRWPSFRPIISLHVFDYLSDSNNERLSEFGTAVKFAGSLEYRKSPFLYKLGELNGVSIQLYGPDFEIERYEMEKCPDGIEYCGAFTPEELPGKLNSGYGLIWDGERLDTCSEGTGKYLSYNSPHKLSLYLASGLPVIVWEGAATAEFVKRNNVGLTINSLFELEGKLNSVSPEQYESYARSAQVIGQKLKEGYYTKTAIMEAEHLLK
ncbi:beta-1,6-galactofuranosyltransferase [Butyrivibrio sp. CB08]|uniref:beta-1,6-galactofuranosyltransferase n=1 Tax=Butyrivibrio sp. CB08 TaxID=2364879 RepID=UPI000EA8B461|nr:beta-1,6-galactofuranosyltransferase [Butyrivibrio sp. CB08]RKM60414.1 beta-1,6-galactofuranosyltransferase [Butyrivibrio sp. CB08]